MTVVISSGFLEESALSLGKDRLGQEVASLHAFCNLSLAQAGTSRLCFNF